jgi:hypothetical protein
MPQGEQTHVRPNPSAYHVPFLTTLFTRLAEEPGLLDTELGEMRCVGDLHRQHLWGSLTDGAPGIKGPLRG